MQILHFTSKKFKIQDSFKIQRKENSAYSYTLGSENVICSLVMVKRESFNEALL